MTSDADRRTGPGSAAPYQRGLWRTFLGMGGGVAAALLGRLVAADLRRSTRPDRPTCPSCERAARVPWCLVAMGREDSQPPATEPPGTPRYDRRPMGPRVLVIDNYDSFVYNLVQELGELGAEPVVFRNDAIDVAGIRAARTRRRPHLAGPGPARGRPGSAWQAIRRAGRRDPAPRGLPRATSASARPTAATSWRRPPSCTARPRRSTTTARASSPACPNPFVATRYHSLVVRPRLGARRARGHRHHDRRGGHGAAPPELRGRGRPVPPRVGAHRRRARPCWPTSSASWARPRRLTGPAGRLSRRAGARGSAGVDRGRRAVVVDDGVVVVVAPWWSSSAGRPRC